MVYLQPQDSMPAPTLPQPVKADGTFTIENVLQGEYRILTEGGPPKSQRSPRAMLQRLEKADAELHRIFTDVRNRSAWDDTFVDALCEPAETFTFGGVFAHIMTFNAHRRLMALDALRQLGVQTEGFGDPMEYEESVAPWNQRLALKTP